VLETAGAGTVLYASDYCHWDCHFPYSVKDIVDAGDLSDEQRARILYKNAVDFFDMKNLPRPRALKSARAGWEAEKTQRAAG
jgi:predicted TIM-barrel fold metal-dependent hydrolase